MQVALIFIGNNPELHNIAKFFSSSLSEKRHIPNLINGVLEKPKLAFFHNLIFFVESPSFFSKNYLEELSLFFKETGSVTSRYASLFTNKTIFSNKYLLKYMNIIEGEGLILHQTGVIKDVEAAKNISSNFEPIKAGE